jgi:hypothetical protein
LVLYGNGPHANFVLGIQAVKDRKGRNGGHICS